MWPSAPTTPPPWALPQAIQSDYAGGNTPIITGQDGDVANLANIVDGIQTMTVYKNVNEEAGVTLSWPRPSWLASSPARNCWTA